MTKQIQDILVSSKDSDPNEGKRVQEDIAALPFNASSDTVLKATLYSVLHC